MPEAEEYKPPVAEGVDAPSAVVPEIPADLTIPELPAGDVFTEAPVPAALGTEVASDAEHPVKEADGRWDHDKAEAMAAVLTESDEDQGSKGLSIKEKFIDNPKETLLENVHSLSSHELYQAGLALKQAQRTSDEAHSRANTDEYFKKESDSRLEDAQERFDTITENNPEVNAEVQKLVMASLDTAEELYGINPEKFANMPTKDFMELVKALKQKNQHVKLDEVFSGEVNRGYYKQKKYELESMLTDRRPMDVGSIKDLALSLDGIHFDYEEDWSDEHKEKGAKYREIIDSLFDKSPKQVIEELVAIAGKHASEADRRRQVAIEDRQAFLDQFKPEPKEPQTD